MEQLRLEGASGGALVSLPAQCSVSYEKVTWMLRALNRQQHCRCFSHSHSTGLITVEHDRLPGASIYTTTSINPNTSSTKQKVDNILNYIFSSIKRKKI